MLSQEIIGFVVTIAVVLLIVGLFVLRERFKKQRRAVRDGNIERVSRKRGNSLYDENGRNAQGEYNRLYDVKVFRSSTHNPDGFCDPRKYPIVLSDHARKRMAERLGISAFGEMYTLAMEAYQYGESLSQAEGHVAKRMETEKSRYQDGIPLLYGNRLYIFTSKNRLISVSTEQPFEG